MPYTDIETAERPKYIILLEDTFGNDQGDVIFIVEETETDIYYYDNFGRWVYLEKNELGIVFTWH